MCVCVCQLGKNYLIDLIAKSLLKQVTGLTYCAAKFELIDIMAESADKNMSASSEDIGVFGKHGTILFIQ